MPTLDLAMPAALLTVIAVALLLNKRVERRLKASVEEREFKTRDIILLVAFMAIIVSVIAYTSLIAPEQAFQNIFLLLFLGSYTMLLYTFSYVFSNLAKRKAQLVSIGFGAASVIAGLASLLGPLADELTVYRTVAFFGLAIFCFGAIALEQKKDSPKERWYVAVQPAAMFVLLILFFNVFYGGALNVWAPYLMDVFGLVFAILIILYLSSLFSWKTVGFFAVLLTGWDIFSVIGTPIMVTAASTFTGIGLPVLVYLPQIPLYITTQGIAFRGLGLGDFFFAGVLATQTLNKFGKKTGFVAAVAMAVAFGIWEAFLPDIITLLTPVVGRNIGGFPGTLMILTGWVPVVAWKLLEQRNKTAKMPVADQASETAKDKNLPLQ